ncbi:MAG: hypothetical protein K9M15_01090 [Candidatus Marinimicrobia bacterium]|nr:hypothetical protein [Candidatus Neomarinimicrobiota bacterium]
MFMTFGLSPEEHDFCNKVLANLESIVEKPEDLWHVCLTGYKPVDENTAAFLSKFKGEVTPWYAKRKDDDYIVFHKIPAWFAESLWTPSQLLFLDW